MYENSFWISVAKNCAISAVFSYDTKSPDIGDCSMINMITERKSGGYYNIYPNLCQISNEYLRKFAQKTICLNEVSLSFSCEFRKYECSDFTN